MFDIMQAIDVLRKYWGHNQFRLKQEEIIQQIIYQKDTLALLPTGGGKSICYQIPSLMHEGICLVISPLISLMDDQVRFLKSKGIKSIAITSGMQYNEIDTALTNCIYGGIKFLYLSPERLKNKLFQTRLKEMNINLITVDEAHCISEWGHNFRPAYRHIAELRVLLPNIPILALTATATQSVVNDIQKNLLFRKKNVVKSSFIRDNLSYVVSNTLDKKRQLLKLISKIKSPTIIYVNSRKATKAITKFLLNNNYSANLYHAGLTNIERNKIYQNWANNKTRIIVATNAFGMGIDKPDVKLIVHMDLPSNIETYFQQTGRAGRNGKQAYAVLLVNNNDISKQKGLLQLRYPSIDEIKQCYQQLANYLQIAENTMPDEPIPFNIIKFSDRYKTNTLKTYNILKYLEREEYLLFSNATNTASRILTKMTRSNLYKFQIANPFYDKFIKLLLRSYPSLFNNYTLINENDIAKQLNISNIKVKDLLNKLMQLEVIKYIPKTNNNQITYLKHRQDIESLYLNDKIWKKRKIDEEAKLSKIINYVIQTEKCRNNLLLNYFGEKNNFKCNKCDVCIREKQKALS